MAFVIAAISLGLLGSLHCVGMCGPIALALPIQGKSNFSRFVGIVTYNIGRIVTYSVLGAIFGLLGQGFAIFGLQQALSITLGVLVLISVLTPSHFLEKFSLTKKLYGFFSKIKNALSFLFQSKTTSSLFYIGLLNGLLPCGLIYIAITGALASGNILDGVIFMAVFGLGTFPAMFSVAWFSNLISMKFRTGVTKAMPYVVSLMAIMLILRGMNLGIPYISPKMIQVETANADCKSMKVDCCHK